MKILCMLILSLCLILQGCGANHCITVGGKYEGVDGTLTYCYSPEKSDKEGKTVLTSDQSDAVLLPAADVADIAAILDTSAQPSAKSLESLTPCQKICERLRIYRNQPTK